MNHYRTNIHKMDVVSFEDFTQRPYEVLLHNVEEIYADNYHYGVLISDTYNDFNDISISKETFYELLEILENGNKSF